MSRFNADPNQEYLTFVGEIQRYLHDHGIEETERAIAEALEAPTRERFKDTFKLDGRTDGANCIGRLIAGWHGCQHALPRKGDDSETPPHHPPHADHCDLWLRDGDPAAFTMHLYDCHREQIADILDFADRWGLDIAVEPSSWYFTNHTVHIVFYEPEWSHG